MFKCNKCNKEFKYDSDYKRHQNRKKSCDEPKKTYDCEVCKLKINYLSKFQEHEKTKKHLINIENSTVNNSFNNSFNHIINLTLNVNSFKKTDTTQIRKTIIEDIGERVYLETMKKTYLTDNYKVQIFFDNIIEILEKLHFNLDIEENHNLKILLIFPGIKKLVYEYLILEINPETKQITWNSLEYIELMEKIFHHLYNLNNTIKNDNYDRLILFLERMLIKDKDSAEEFKPYIEKKLGDMYINFNDKQKKDKRKVEEDITDKYTEYINYRTQECKLNNGYNPDIINSQIKK
jgi:hypothetical protein